MSEPRSELRCNTRCPAPRQVDPILGSTAIRALCPPSNLNAEQTFDHRLDVELNDGNSSPFRTSHTRSTQTYRANALGDGSSVECIGHTHMSAEVSYSDASSPQSFSSANSHASSPQSFSNANSRTSSQQSSSRQTSHATSRQSSYSANSHTSPQQRSSSSNSPTSSQQSSSSSDSSTNSQQSSNALPEPALFSAVREGTRERNQPASRSSESIPRATSTSRSAQSPHTQSIVNLDSADFVGHRTSPGRHEHESKHYQQSSKALPEPAFFSAVREGTLEWTQPRRYESIPRATSSSVQSPHTQSIVNLDSAVSVEDRTSPLLHENESKRSDALRSGNTVVFQHRTSLPRFDIPDNSARPVSPDAIQSTEQHVDSVAINVVSSDGAI